MDLAVKAVSLTKSYRNIFAVDGLSFEVRRGEIFGLVGPDGAGKTTTLRMISTALFPDAGTATVEGFDISKQTDDVRLNIGYMPQSMSLYGDLTVEEQLNFHADLYMVDRRAREEKKKELYAFSNLGPFKDRPAEKLSGGMKKKLALACTLIHTPKVLILDEPTTGVDPLSRRELWGILYSLLPAVTVILSTPYMDEAERCNTVGLMYGGRLKLMDHPEKLVKDFHGKIIEVRCERLRLALPEIEKLPGVKSAQIFGDSMHAAVDSLDGKMKMIETALRSAGFGVHLVREIPPRLEDVFISLLGG